MSVEIEVYVCRETGKIYTISTDPLEAELDEPPGDLETSDNYLMVPSKAQLKLGRDVVFDFILATLPAEFDEVRDIFRRSGAYRRFKDWLRKHQKLTEWHAYEERATEDALRAWCAENGLESSDA